VLILFSEITKMQPFFTGIYYTSLVLLEHFWCLCLQVMYFTWQEHTGGIATFLHQRGRGENFRVPCHCT